ncbi:BBT_HP_G0001750.mRNA.1.CDS.1 [Saccharomyces cerevisiae]|nr:BBT_HP_G0001750.mRNA.1.CDS.1 [Saccharomyces cerevisiae]CAI6791459.1 BBT_HP_G0001750.mRNA.1.CDS.1 [Saccharomyces cerevisiae]
MSSVYYNNHNETYNIYGKGAFESIISCCSSWYGKDGVKITPLTDCDVETIRKNVYSLSNEGLRVLGLPPNLSLKIKATAESDLVFLGLIGIYDPPRNETAGAVKKFHQAGINVHMLTGDFVGTAKAIAQEVGILPTNLYHYSQEIVDSMVMTGSQFDGLSEEEVDDLPVLPLVIARCSPQTKVRMIEALHRRKKFCAMTGDGVNDSPSLKWPMLVLQWVLMVQMFPKKRLILF